MLLNKVTIHERVDEFNVMLHGVQTQLSSQQFQELFLGQTGLVDDGFEGAALEVAIVHRQGNAQFGTSGVFKDVMAAARVVNKKPCSLKGPQHSFGLASRETDHASGAPRE